jgi:hypothetical protein
MAFNTDSPDKYEAVLIQRANNNSYYEEIHISGSDSIFYLSSSGELTADKISIFAAKYGLIGATLSTSSTYPFTASWAINTVNGSSGTTLSTGSTYPFTSSQAISSSYSLSSSFALSASWAPSVGGGITLGTGSTYPFTSSWSINSIYNLSSSYASSSLSSSYSLTSSYSFSSSYVLSSSYTLSSSYSFSSSYALSASWAPSVGGGTLLETGSTYPFTASWSINSTNNISSSYASSSLSSSYSFSSSYSLTASYTTPVVKSIVLCSAYTPTTSGPDAAEITIPYNHLSLPITYSIRRTSIRTQTVESSISSSIIIEQYSGSSFFTANNSFGQVDLLSGSYQNYNTNITQSVVSGDKIRFKILTLGTSTNWTIITEISTP